MKIQYSIAREYKGSGPDPSFTLGNAYLVLGIRFSKPNHQTLVAIRRDSDGTPVLTELRHFTIVDATIPPGWCFLDFGEYGYALEPKEFGGDFWTRFNDANSEAESIFEQVVKALEAFHVKTSE